jgi:4-amino-4-deoxy-L-arabinose transferase-like glycosyltransferase
VIETTFGEPGARSRDRRYGIRLVGILLTGFLLRLAIDVWIPTQPVSDFFLYFRRAESLARSGRDEIRPGIPEASHPPAYAVVLSAALKAAPPEDGLLAAKTANAALALVAAALGAILARGLWGDAAGLWTAALFSFFPRSLLMSDLIASENLFTPLLLLFLLLAVRRWISIPSIGLAAAAGAAIGLLTLTRSVAYLLPLVWLAGALAGRERSRRIAAELVVLVAVEHAVLLPWGIHNARAIGRFTFLSTVGGVGLFIGNNPHATGDWYEWAEDLERLRPGVGAQGALAVDDAAKEEAWRWMRANPGRAAALYLRKLRIILTDDGFAAGLAIFAEHISPPSPPADVLPGAHRLKSQERTVRLGLRMAGLLLALAVLGGFLALVRRARQGSIPDRALAVGFAAAAFYVPIVSAVIAVNGRYRWPSEDVILPLAGMWLAKVTTPSEAQRTRRERISR